jgi:hypothetical protein
MPAAATISIMDRDSVGRKVKYTSLASLTLVAMVTVTGARAQGTSESTAIEYQVARSVALKAHPRFDSRTIRILEAGTLLSGYLLENGDWWQANYGRLKGYIRDSAIDTTGRRGIAVAQARRLIAQREAVAARAALRDSLRDLVVERRARQQFLDRTATAHAEGVERLRGQGILVSLLTARFQDDRRLSRREREMMKLEEQEWESHCLSLQLDQCTILPRPAWGYVLSLENLYESPVDSVFFELVVFDSDGLRIDSALFRGIGPVTGGVPGGFWQFEPRSLPRRTACAELVELEIEWRDGLIVSYSAEDLRRARLPLVARGWPLLEVGPIGTRYIERSRLAFGLNEIVLDGDCVVR